jgi:hypothetical protein
MDRLTIVGSDGQDRILIQDEVVVDLTIQCSDFETSHVHHITHLDGLSQCTCCGQSVQALVLKGDLFAIV